MSVDIFLNIEAIELPYESLMLLYWMYKQKADK